MSARFMDYGAEMESPSNAGSSIRKAVEAATSPIQFRETKGPFENRVLRAKLCDAIVTMMQATDFWRSKDSADRLHGARIR